MTFVADLSEGDGKLSRNLKLINSPDGQCPALTLCLPEGSM